MLTPAAKALLLKPPLSETFARKDEIQQVLSTTKQRRQNLRTTDSNWSKKETDEWHKIQNRWANILCSSLPADVDSAFRKPIPEGLRIRHREKAARATAEKFDCVSRRTGNAGEGLKLDAVESPLPWNSLKARVYKHCQLKGLSSARGFIFSFWKKTCWNRSLLRSLLVSEEAPHGAIDRAGLDERFSLCCSFLLCRIVLSIVRYRFNRLKPNRRCNQITQPAHCNPLTIDTTSGGKNYGRKALSVLWKSCTYLWSFEKNAFLTQFRNRRCHDLWAKPESLWGYFSVYGGIGIAGFRR